MNAQLPIRDHARQREAASRLFFQGRLPAAWTWEIPEPDYGVDLRVGVVENNLVTGLEFLVQLKASDNPSNGECEPIRLQVSTYNYLMASLSVAMLVKYIASEQEAYWVLLRDIPPPPQAQQSFTVRVPRSNRVSDLDWQQLRGRLGNIHELKHGAGRREARDA
jgi:hypothetical protein